jgi:hypothetical protein
MTIDMTVAAINTIAATSDARPAKIDAKIGTKSVARNAAKSAAKTIGATIVATSAATTGVVNDATIAGRTPRPDSWRRLLLLRRPLRGPWRR